MPHHYCVLCPFIIVLNIFRLNKDTGKQHCNYRNPTLAKCEDETHTSKVGDLESSETLENSELDCRGQNTLHWSVLNIIGKVFKCRCPMASHEPFGHLQPKLWAKEGLGVKLAI